MTVTAHDVEAEHRQALASLSLAQRRALDRMREAKQRTHFSGGRVEEQLKALFEAEAASRTRAEDEALFEAARIAAESAVPLQNERRRLEAALGRGFPAAA